MGGMRRLVLRSDAMAQDSSDPTDHHEKYVLVACTHCLEYIVDLLSQSSLERFHWRM